MSPGRDRVVTIKSRMFFILRRFGVAWVFIDLPGVVIWQHVHPSSFTWINPLWASSLLSRKHAPFRCERCCQSPHCPPTSQLQMFLKPQVRVECGNRTHEHQSGHQSSYWLRTSVLNFGDLTRTGVTRCCQSPHCPPTAQL